MLESRLWGASRVVEIAAPQCLKESTQPGIDYSVASQKPQTARGRGLHEEEGFVSYLASAHRGVFAAQVSRHVDHFLEWESGQVLAATDGRMALIVNWRGGIVGSGSGSSSSGVHDGGSHDGGEEDGCDDEQA